MQGGMKSTLDADFEHNGGFTMFEPKQGNVIQKQISHVWLLGNVASDFVNVVFKL